MIVKANDSALRRSSGAQDTTVLSGIDWAGTISNCLIGLAVMLLLLWCLPRSQWPASLPWYWVVPASLLLSFACAGNRYRLTLSPKGIELRLYRFWFVPLVRRRDLLDAEIELYETWESDKPEGLCVRAPFWDSSSDKEIESACFGPSTNEERLRAIVEALAMDLVTLRKNAPKPPRELRHPRFAAFSRCFDWAFANWDENGRLREVFSKEEIAIGEIKIPAGSQFFWNGDGFIDPRREDRLVKVMLAAPTKIAGLVAQAQACLFFFPSGQLSSLRSAFEGEVEIDGNWIEGAETIAFGRDGVLSYFTLARPIVASGIEIPRGTTVNRYAGDSILPAYLRCSLRAPLLLPEAKLRPGDTILLSGDGRSITGISPKKDIALRGKTIRAGIVPIPLQRDLSVDMRKCREYGIVADDAEKKG